MWQSFSFIPIYERSVSGYLSELKPGSQTYLTGHLSSYRLYTRGSTCQTRQIWGTAQSLSPSRRHSIAHFIDVTWKSTRPSSPAGDHSEERWICFPNNSYEALYISSWYCASKGRFKAPVPSLSLLETSDDLLNNLIVSIQNPCNSGNKFFGKVGDLRLSKAFDVSVTLVRNL